MHSGIFAHFCCCQLSHSPHGLFNNRASSADGCFFLLSNWKLSVFLKVEQRGLPTHPDCGPVCVCVCVCVRTLVVVYCACFVSSM